MTTDKRPIIIIKRKSSHAGHHGGAWKVAYADFVTAMMALFIVLWLTSSGEKVKKSIAGYFNDPTGTSKEIGSDLSGDSESIPIDKKDVSQLKARLEEKISKQPDLQKLKNQIDIVITPEGMRIELMESKDGTFFETGSAVLNSTGRELLTLLAKELGAVPNRISLEGHTDAHQYVGGSKYDNWELSTDRANAARRLMQSTGMHSGQLAQVRGFADQQLRVPADPMDPSNRRISVIVHYIGFSMKSPDEASAAKFAGVLPTTVTAKTTANTRPAVAATALKPVAAKPPGMLQAKTHEVTMWLQATAARLHLNANPVPVEAKP